MDEKLKGILTEAHKNGADREELKRLTANYLAEKKKEDSSASPSGDGSSVSQGDTETIEAPASLRAPRPGFNYKESDVAEVQQKANEAITEEVFQTPEEALVPRLRQEFGQYGFTVEEAIGGDDAVTLRSSEGDAVKTFNLEYENARYREGGIEGVVSDMRNFVTSNARGEYYIAEEDQLSKALRAKNLRSRPRITSEGETEDLKMIAYEQDGAYYTVPTLFPKNPERYTSMSDDWIEVTDPAQAIAIAKRRGEVFYHETEEEAKAYARGQYKEVNTLDLEADRFFKERNLDYMTIKNARDKYNEVNDKLSSLDAAEEAADEEGVEPTAFVDGQKVENFEAYKAQLEDQRDQLFNVVFEENAIDTQDAFDLYTAKQAKATAKEAARLNAQANAFDEQINASSMEYFGVPASELGTVDTDMPELIEQANYLYTLYQKNEATKKSAARNFELSSEYFDAQQNKMIQREFAQGMDGVRENWNESWDTGEAGAIMMAYHIADASGVEYSNDDVKEIARQIAEYQRAASIGPEAMTQGIARIQNAKYWKEWLTAIDSPGKLAETVGAITSQSMALMLPAGLEIAKVVIPASVSTGATVGSVLPGVGTAVGAAEGLKQGIRLSFAAMGAAVEYNSSIFEAMSEKGYDLTDPEQVYAALNDGEVIAKGRDIGTKRGLAIGIVDYLSAGLAGRIFAVSPMSSVARRVGSATLNQAAFGPGAEAFGEYTAQVAAGQQVDGKEIFLEGLGALGNNSGNLAVNMYSNVSGKARKKFLNNLQSASFVQSLDASDERIMSFVEEQRNMGKLTADQAQNVEENLGARREARKIMDTVRGGKGLAAKAVSRIGSGNAKAESRLMELIKARNKFEGLGPTFSSLISDVNKEIQEIAVTGRLTSDPVNIGGLAEQAVTEALRPKYIIDGQSMTDEDARTALEQISDEELLAAARRDGAIRIENDEEFVNEINERLDAIQEQSTAEVPVRETPEASEAVGEEVRRTEEPAQQEEAEVENEVSQLEELFGTAASPTEAAPAEAAPAEAAPAETAPAETTPTDEPPTPTEEQPAEAETPEAPTPPDEAPPAAPAAPAAPAVPEATPPAEAAPEAEVTEEQPAIEEEAEAEAPAPEAEAEVVEEVVEEQPTPEPEAEAPTPTPPAKPKQKRKASKYKKRGKGRYTTTIDGFDYAIEQTARDEWIATEQESGESIYGRTLKDLKEIVGRLNDNDDLPHVQNYGRAEVKNVNRSYDSIDELAQDYNLNEDQVQGLRAAIEGVNKGVANIKARFERGATDKAPAAVGITYGPSDMEMTIEGLPKNKEAIQTEGKDNTEKIEEVQESKDKEVSREPSAVDTSGIDRYEASMAPIVQALKSISDPIRLFEKLQRLTRGRAIPASQMYLALSENPALTPAQRLIAKRIGETLRAKKGDYLVSVSTAPVMTGTEFMPNMGVASSDANSGIAFFNHPKNYLEAVSRRDSYNGRRLWEVMLHEGVHLTADMAVLNDKAMSAEMTRINNLVVEAIKADPTLRERFKIIDKYLNNKNNAFANPREILAWGLTSRDMQEVLKSIEDPKGKTAWDSFVSAVRKALGLPDKPKVATALDSLMAAYASLEVQEKEAVQKKEAKPKAKGKPKAKTTADKLVKVDLQEVSRSMSVGVLTKATSIELTRNNKTKQWTAVLTNKNGSATMKFNSIEEVAAFFNGKTYAQVDAMTGRTGVVSEMREADEVQFRSETTGTYASEDQVAATVEAMNNMPEAAVLAEVDMTQEPGGDTDVEGLNTRLEAPLEKVQIDIIRGLPAMFTISDWLTSGSVTNPLTGNTIDNLQGGLGFNGISALNTEFAWANTSRKAAVDTLEKAKRLYEQNKAVFDKWWKANPQYDGLVPVNVVRMLEDSNLSNEAGFRVLVDNMRQLPKGNRAKALVEYKRHLRSEIAKANEELKEAKAEARKKKTAAASRKVEISQRGIDKIRMQLDATAKYRTLDDFFDGEFNNEDGLFNARNDSSPYTLGDRPDIMSLLTVGGIEPAERMYVSKTNAIVSALLGIKEGQKTSSIPEARRRLLRFADVFGPITEQATENAPPRSIISIVGIDVRQNDIASTDHPNYPYGTIGRSIGVVDTPVPVHMAYPSIYSKVVAAAQATVARGDRPSAGQAISDGVAVQAGVSSNTFIGDVFEGELSNAAKLARFLNLAFPKSNLYVSQEMFDAAMATEGAQKQYATIGGERRVIYGLTANGNVYINPEVHNSESELFNTAIHEFSHVWMDHLAQTPRGKAILARGYKLVQQTQVYKEQLEKFGGDKQAAANEALAILIGNKGQTIVEASLKARFKEFLNAVWSYIRNSFKLSSELTQSEIESLTLDGFIGTAMADIFAGTESLKLTDKQMRNLNEAGVKFSSTESIDNIVRIARDNGFSDTSIKVFLKRQGFDAAAIKDAMRITIDLQLEVPTAFNEVVGGARVGAALFNEVMQELAQFANSKNPTNAELRQKAQDILKGKQEFINQSDTVQKGMLVAVDKSVGLSANNKVAEEIKAIRQQLRDRKLGANEARAAQKVLRDFIKANVKTTTANRADVNRLIKLVSDTNSSNVQAQVLEAQKILNSILAKDAKAKAKLEALKGKVELARAKARSLAEAQKTIRQFISKTLPRTDYGKKQLTKFNTMVSKATPDTINGIMEDVVEEVNRINVRNLNREVEQLLSTKTASVVGGRLKGRLSPEAQVRFENIKAMLAKKGEDPAEIEKMVTSQQEKYDKLDANADSSEETLQEMFDLTIAIHYNSALLLSDTDQTKVMELETVVEQLTIFLNEERSVFSDMIAEQKAYYNRIKSEFFTDVSGVEIDFSDPESVEAAREAIRQRQNLKNNRPAFVRVLKGVFSAFDSAVIRTEALEGLLDRVSVMPGEMFGGKSKELILDKINDSSNILKAGKEEIYAQLEAKQREIFGDKFDRKMREFTKQTEFYYTNPKRAAELESVLEDTTTPVQQRKDAEYELSKLRTRISQNEMYYLYNQYKDEANHAGLKATLGDNLKEVMEQVERKLDPGVKEWADWQVNEFFPSVYERYNSVYKRVYRTNMPWNEKYAGRVIREREADNITDFSNFRQYQTRVGGQSTKVRSRNANKIIVRDGDNALAAYIGDMEFFHAYAENIRDVQKMIKSPEVKDAIEATTGEEAYKILDGQLEKVMSRSLAKGDTVKMLDYFTNTYVVSKLGLNPTIYIKQMTSALAFADYIGYAKWSEYSARALTKGVGTWNAEWKEMMANSVYLQDRYKRSNITRVLENYTPERQDSLLGGHTAGKVNDFFMYLVKAGDMGGVMGSIPNYLFYKDQYRAKNPSATEQQVVEYAIKRIEDQVKSTQQSQDVQDKDFTQTDHYMLRFFNMFLSSSKALFRKEVIAVRNLYRKMTGQHSKGTTKENVRTLLTYHVAIPMLFQYVALGFPGLLRGWREEDEEALTWAAILGNINAVFVLGDIAVGLSDAAQGRPWAGDMRTIPLLSDAGDIIQNYKKFSEAKTDETKDKYLMKIMTTIIQTGTGIPFANLVKLAENYKELAVDGVEDNGEALLRFLGYGDYQIEGSQKKKSSGRGRSVPSRGR